MRTINTKTIYIKNPDTNDFEGLAALQGAVGPQGPAGPAGPAGGVSSVNNKTGDVTLNAADVGAVAKTGDIMTGELSVPELNVQKGTNEYSSVNYFSANGDYAGGVMMNSTNGSRRLNFKHIHNDQDGNSTKYYDSYQLPTATAGLTSNNYYQILTTKSPVAITQGGTGATDPGTACKNLMIGVNIEPNALELHPTSTNAGHGGYIDFHFNNDSGDYTSRIIENTKGALSINTDGTVKLGTVTYGTWNGTAIGIAYGGTGATSARAASVNLLRDTTLATTTTPTADYNGIFYTTMPDTAAGTGDITAGSLLHVQNSTNRGFQIAAQAYGSTIKWRGIHSGSTSDAGTEGYKTWYTFYHSGNKPTTSDIGAAPTSHASTATTYGVSSASNYGHAMASSTTPKALGTAAVGSETAKFARGDHVHALPALTSCTGTLTVAKGGTGATSAANARKNLEVPTFTYTSSSKTLALTTT